MLTLFSSQYIFTQWVFYFSYGYIFVLSSKGSEKKGKMLQRFLFKMTLEMPPKIRKRIFLHKALPPLSTTTPKKRGRGNKTGRARCFLLFLVSNQRHPKPKTSSFIFIISPIRSMRIFYENNVSPYNTHSHCMSHLFWSLDCSSLWKKYLAFFTSL